MTEFEAIITVAIGGALLTDGYGSVLGTELGMRQTSNVLATVD